MKKKSTLFLLLFSTALFSAPSIKLNDIQEYKITKEKVLYRIDAKSKNISYKKLKKFRFYNKEKLISNSSYYLNGEFNSENLNIKFRKAYFLEGKFIMLDVAGKYKNSPFKAKKAIYTKKDLKFKNVFITLNGKKYRKIKYSLPISD